MSFVAVVGGGASGLMAAYSAASCGHCVCLLEKNEKTGKKLYITGKGRCNVTNACDFALFEKHIVNGGRFLYSSLNGFFNTDLCMLLESAGCRLKTERGDRVFPVSDHASDVTKALMKLLDEAKAEICLHTEVTKISVSEKESSSGTPAKAFCPAGNDLPPKGICSSEREEEKRRFCLWLKTPQGTQKRFFDAVIVCTGGLSYPATGSTGDGYRFAADAGLTVRKQNPSLVPFTVREPDCAKLQGLSLRNVAVTVRELSGEQTGMEGHVPKKSFWEDFGELLFTHFGVSGPLALRASAFLSEPLSEGRRFSLTVDLKPALTEEKLDERLLRDFADAKNAEMLHALEKLLPSSLRPVVLERSRIDPHRRVRDLTREERQRLVHTMKALSYTVTGTRGFSEAVITQGGICLDEINPKTMMSKKVGGLYFAGEVLDIDALTGGFNLQLAFSTGYAAGQHIP